MFAVELDDLLATVDDLAACGSDLDALLADVVRRIVTLHGTWEGRAALAQAAAQADWEAGFRAMREGLATMRSAASTAHGNYGDAVAANLRMWEQVR